MTTATVPYAVAVISGVSKTNMPEGSSATQKDIITGGIVAAALLLFVGAGGSALSESVLVLTGMSSRTDNTMVSAVLLNIAIILFGWRRYRELKQEVVKRIDAEQRAQALALTDPLTNLHNRRALKERSQILARQAGERGKSVAMLLVDLDNFKQINDLHGHDAGDTVLMAFAQRLRQNAPPGSYIARLGGDEFACVCIFDRNFPKPVERMAQDIIEHTAGPVTHHGESLMVTTSIGISMLDQDCATIDHLMRRADMAMYAAKHAGKNAFAWFEPRMETSLRDRTQLEADIRRGLAAGEFIPYYQQQVDLSNGQLNGFEMLARWTSPTRGMVMPDDFIYVAEEMGVIGELSMLVMRQAFEEARDWDSALTLSVNISPQQFLDPWLAQKIVKLLVETGFPANRLEIEITESSLVNNMALAKSIIMSLKNQGIGIALDDFGTGYSSLAHLRALPFDRIKIDRSFINSFIESADSAAIVSAIVGLGQSLGIPITAEGIEDPAIIERLNELGELKGQGWLFGKAMPSAKTRSLLASLDMLAAPCEPDIGHDGAIPNYDQLAASLIRGRAN